ncbi:MAG: hypothetical protein ACP5TI_03295 [Thermoprotei archaeon]
MPIEMWEERNGYGPYSDALAGGIGWAVFEALKGGGKGDSEIKGWIATRMGETISFSLIPMLDWWANRRIIIKRDNDKYALSEGAVLGRLWATSQEGSDKETAGGDLDGAEGSVEHLSDKEDRDSLSAYAPRIKDLIVKLTNMLG